MNKESTFKETREWLISHGWEKIGLRAYILEKKLKKRHTARIGVGDYFRLKKTKEEIEKSK